MEHLSSPLDESYKKNSKQYSCRQRRELPPQPTDCRIAKRSIGCKEIAAAQPAKNRTVFTIVLTGLFILGSSFVIVICPASFQGIITFDVCVGEFHCSGGLLASWQGVVPAICGEHDGVV